MPDNSEPLRFINPFEAYELYRKAGWLGPLPLPYKEKHPPPDHNPLKHSEKKSFTGKAAPFPTAEELTAWRDQGKHNICLRIAGVDKDYEVIGIDVDHYRKGDKDKKGGDQLQKLENAHGALPATWISSARTDGISGIRYYRVPRGLAFRGQVDKDIECISKGYRFSVVWPSIHTEGHEGNWTYWWFPPEVRPTAVGRSVWTGDVPQARSLPVLPEKWLDYLTRGRTPFTADEVDLDSSKEDIYGWADDTLPDGANMCGLMAAKLESAKQMITNEATSHDKLTNAHMNIFHLAREGHTGWNVAVNDMEAHFVDVMIKRDKRDLNELRGEIFRSRINGLRKTKGKIDVLIKAGAQGVPGDLCDQNVGTGNSTVPVSWSGIPPAGGNGTQPAMPWGPAPDHEMTDDGNAEHFISKHSLSDGTPTVRYISDMGRRGTWMIWREGLPDGSTQPHWELDDQAGALIRQQWWVVKKDQKDYVDRLKTRVETQLLAARNAGQPLTGAAAPQALQDAKAELKLWQRFANLSGMNKNSEDAIKAAAKRPGVTVKSTALDPAKGLLAVANGVLELGADGVQGPRKARMDDMITMNTGIPWTDTPHKYGAKLWNDFLDKFLPEPEIRRIAQIAMGYQLMGGNSERVLIILIGQTSTGKSTFANICRKALGDYGAPAAKQLFQSKQFNPTLTLNSKKRLLTNTEFDNNVVVSSSAIKELTGGSDEIAVERKGVDEVSVGDPHFGLVIATNEYPKLNEPDQAVERRLYPIEFNHVMALEDQDINAADQMEKIALDSVLAWMIEGYRMYCENGGLVRNILTRKWQQKAMQDIDDISVFIEECFEVHDNARKPMPKTFWSHKPDWCIEANQMKSIYEDWCRRTGVPEFKMLSVHKITKRLSALGYIKPDNPIRVTGAEKTGKYWLGLKKKRASAFIPSLEQITKNLATPTNDQEV